MPSVRYTRIEITPDAYRSLEAEAILQGKTLKKLASELIIKGVSKKALDFVQEVEDSEATSSEPKIELTEDISKVIKKIGATGIHFSGQTLQKIKDAVLGEGYQAAMLSVAQHTASMERDELHRVIAICRSYKLSTNTTAYLIENLNEIETGNWK